MSHGAFHINYAYDILRLPLSELLLTPSPKRHLCNSVLCEAVSCAEPSISLMLRKLYPALQNTRLHISTVRVWRKEDPPTSLGGAVRIGSVVFHQFIGSGPLCASEFFHLANHKEAKAQKTQGHDTAGSRPSASQRRTRREARRNPHNDCQAESTRGVADVPGRDISFIDFKGLLSKNRYVPQEGGVVIYTCCFQ